MSKLEDAFVGLLDFALVKSAKLAESTFALLATVLGDEGEDETEEAEGQEVWGHAAILWHPVAQDDDGEVEGILLRRGEDRLIIAHRDLRWQVTLEEGEVILRAFGDSASSVHLKPSGEVVINAGGDVLIGDDTAAKALALAEKVDANFDNLKTAYDGHVHSGVTTGTGSSGPPGSPLAAFSGTGSTKAKATE